MCPEEIQRYKDDKTHKALTGTYVNYVLCSHLYGLPQVFDFLCFKQASDQEALHDGSEVTQRPLLLRCYNLLHTNL